jgi:MFS family permease
VKLDRAQTRRRSIIACIAATMTMSITLGLCWPMLALVLELQGVSPWLNGLSAAAQMLAILPVMWIAPFLIGRLGTGRAMASGMAVMALGLILLPIFDNVWAWFPIRFGIGLGGELVFIAGDIWINQLAEERTRGRLIGVYGIFMTAGFAVGPLALVALGTEDWTVLYLAIGVVVLGLGILAVARPGSPAAGEKPRARLIHFMRIAPALMVAGLMFGLLQSSSESLMVVYGIKKGLDKDSAALLISAIVLGALLVQFPVGWLADHMSSRKLLTAGAVATLFSFVALPFSLTHTVSMWGVMLLMGASTGSFYVVAMTMMGRRFRGVDLIGINTSFGFVWGTGGTVGPGLAGLSMDMLGPEGMPGLGVVLCVLFLIVCLKSPEEPVGAPVGAGP